MNQEYVIMLDYLLEVYTHHWPITSQSDSLDALRQERQHDGSPAVVPRSNVQMVLLENKSLINSTNARIDRGAIYKVAH